MKKIAITGSLASGKTTAGKILSVKGPVFSSDKEVSKLYNKKVFKKYIGKKFKIENTSNIKKKIKKKILENNININKLEKIIHPFVKKKRDKFIQKNRKKPFMFFEITLLVERKLMRKFDIIIFIKARKNIRLKRFTSKGGNKKLFNILNNKQLSDFKKRKYCDHTVVNEKNFKILKKKLFDILDKYERSIFRY